MLCCDYWQSCVNFLDYNHSYLHQSAALKKKNSHFGILLFIFWANPIFSETPYYIITDRKKAPFFPYLFYSPDRPSQKFIFKGINNPSNQEMLALHWQLHMLHNKMLLHSGQWVLGKFSIKLKDALYWYMQNRQIQVIINTLLSLP